LWPRSLEGAANRDEFAQQGIDTYGICIAGDQDADVGVPAVFFHRKDSQPAIACHTSNDIALGKTLSIKRAIREAILLFAYKLCP